MVHTTPIRDASGEVVAVMEMHTDIGEVKELQKELHQSQERLAQLFEEVPCFITVQGPDRVIQHANRRFREIFGEAVGEECFRVYKHRDEQCLSCPMMSTFETGETHEYEGSVISKDGEELNLLVTTAPMRNSDGVVEAVIEMGVDITQIRQLQDQLTSIGLLVGSISHGIKGLLTGLDGGIYMVNSGFERDKPERVKKGWEMVQRNVDRIRSMVLDILYYAKDRELIVEDIGLAGMIDELRDGVREEGQRNSGLTFGLNSPTTWGLRRRSPGHPRHADQSHSKTPSTPVEWTATRATGHRHGLRAPKTVDDHRGRGQRDRNGPRDPRKDLLAVLLVEGPQRHRAGAVHLEQDRRQARRHHRCGVRGGQRDAIRRPNSAGGPPEHDTRW